MKKMVNQVDLAKLAEVTRGAISRMCKEGGKLHHAVNKRSGKVDISDPIVDKYIKRKKSTPKIKSKTVGIDDRYELAIEHCRKAGRYGISFIAEYCRVGKTRAKKIQTMMDLAGLIPKQGEPPPVIEPIAAPPQPVFTADTHHAPDTGVLDVLSGLQTFEDGMPEDIKEVANMSVSELISRFGTSAGVRDWLRAVKEIEMIHERRLKNATTEGTLINRDVVKTVLIASVDLLLNRLLSDGAKAISHEAITRVKAGADDVEVRKSVEDILASFIKPFKDKQDIALKQIGVK